MKSVAMKDSKIYGYVFGVYLLLLCVYVYSSLDGLVSQNVTIYPQFAQASVMIMTISLLLLARKHSNNSWYRLFIFWYISYIILYNITPHYEVGAIGIFRITWFLNAFFISYICSQWIADYRRFLVIACVILLAINVYFFYLNLYSNVAILAIEDIGVSNTVFWSFCLFPLVFFIENPLYRNIIIGVIAIICLFTMKRSAFIALSCILFFYIFKPWHENNKRPNSNKTTYIFLSLIVIMFFLYNYSDQFLEIFDRNINRINSIAEDRGSNRLTVWADVLNALQNNTITETILGNGMGSTLIKAHHTTAHNDFLTIFFEFGIIGTIFYVTFILKLIKITLSEWKNKSVLFMPYVSSLLILLIIGNVGDMFTCYSYLAYIMCLIGVLEGSKYNRSLIN